MNRLFYVARGLATTIALFATVSAHSIENEPASFRGIEWSGPQLESSGLLEEVFRPNQLGSLSISPLSKGAVKSYIKPDDKMEFGGVPLTRIAYYFYTNKFMQAVLEYWGTTEYPTKIGEFPGPNYSAERKVNAALKQYFGPDDASKLSFLERLKADKNAPGYVGENVDINNQCKNISPQSMRYNCVLTFTFKPLRAQADAEIKAIADNDAAAIVQRREQKEAARKEKPDF